MRRESKKSKLSEKEILMYSDKVFVLCYFPTLALIQTPYLLPPQHQRPTVSCVTPRTSCGEESGRASELLSLTSRPSCTLAPIALSPPAGAAAPAGEPLPLEDGRSAPIATTHFFPSLPVPVDRGVRGLARTHMHALSRAHARACS